MRRREFIACLGGAARLAARPRQRRRNLGFFCVGSACLTGYAEDNAEGRGFYLAPPHSEMNSQKPRLGLIGPQRSYRIALRPVPDRRRSRRLRADGAESRSNPKAHSFAGKHNWRPYSPLRQSDHHHSHRIRGRPPIRSVAASSQAYGTAPAATSRASTVLRRLATAGQVAGTAQGDCLPTGRTRGPWSCSIARPPHHSNDFLGPSSKRLP